MTFTSGANHSISGNNSFYNLVMDNSALIVASTLTFQAGSTTTIQPTGSLTLKGNLTAPLSLQSSTSGTQWHLNAPSGITVGPDLGVKDSGSSNTIHSGLGYVNNGNDPNWTFP